MKHAPSQIKMPVKYKMKDGKQVPGSNKIEFSPFSPKNFPKDVYVVADFECFVRTIQEEAWPNISQKKRVREEVLMAEKKIKSTHEHIPNSWCMQIVSTVPEIPDRPGLVIQGGQVLRVLIALWALWALLALKWLHPGFFSTIWGVLLGAGAGAGGVYLYFINVKTKKVLNDGVRALLTAASCHSRPHLCESCCSWQRCPAGFFMAPCRLSGSPRACVPSSTMRAQSELVVALLLLR